MIAGNGWLTAEPTMPMASSPVSPRPAARARRTAVSTMDSAVRASLTKDKGRGRLITEILRHLG